MCATKTGGREGEGRSNRKRREGGREREERVRERERERKTSRERRGRVERHTTRNSKHQCVFFQNITAVRLDQIERWRFNQGFTM